MNQPTKKKSPRIKKNKSDKKNQNYNRNVYYKLREVNYSQFYRSPIKTFRIEEDENSLIGSRIRRPGERLKTQNSRMNSAARRSRRERNNNISNNIDRSRGKIELDPKYRSIDFDNDNDNYDYSEN